MIKTENKKRETFKTLFLHGFVYDNPQIPKGIYCYVNCLDSITYASFKILCDFSNVIACSFHFASLFTNKFVNTLKYTQVCMEISSVLHNIELSDVINDRLTDFFNAVIFMNIISQKNHISIYDYNNNNDYINDLKYCNQITNKKIVQYRYFNVNNIEYTYVYDNHNVYVVNLCIKDNLKELNVALLENHPGTQEPCLLVSCTGILDDTNDIIYNVYNMEDMLMVSNMIHRLVCNYHRFTNILGSIVKNIFNGELFEFNQYYWSSNIFDSMNKFSGINRQKHQPFNNCSNNIYTINNELLLNKQLISFLCKNSELMRSKCYVYRDMKYNEGLFILK